MKAEKTGMGRSAVSHARTFTNGSSKEYQKKKMFGRGRSGMKNGREVKTNGVK